MKNVVKWGYVQLSLKNSGKCADLKVHKHYPVYKGKLTKIISVRSTQAMRKQSLQQQHSFPSNKKSNFYSLMIAESRNKTVIPKEKDRCSERSRKESKDHCLAIPVWSLFEASCFVTLEMLPYPHPKCVLQDPLDTTSECHVGWVSMDIRIDRHKWNVAAIGSGLLTSRRLKLRKGDRNIERPE